MPWVAPAGHTVITVDLGCTVADEVWTMSETQLGEFCLQALEPIIPNAKKAFLGCRVLRTPFAYPIFLSEYDQERCRFRQTTGVNGLYSVGRNGEFDHLLTEDVYWRTLRKMPEIIKFLAERTRPRQVYATA
jgi:protoporphyrinogen/coproporphyrinogen III oxidase